MPPRLSPEEQALREAKKASEAARKKLPRLTSQQLSHLLMEGQRVFHNGGTRKRIVTGVDLYIYYKTSETAKTTSGIWRDAFLQWAKGYVDDDGRLMVWSKDDEEWVPL